MLQGADPPGRFGLRLRQRRVLPQCGISPAPAPERLPDAPLPRTDRDSVTGLPNGPPKITPVIEPDDTTPSMASLVVGLRAGKTHNEVQALLGVWQT